MLAVVTIEFDRTNLGLLCLQSTVRGELAGRREELGWGSAMLDPHGEELHLLRLDVVKLHRGRGYGLVQVLALLQGARAAGLPDTARIRVIADEAETPQLRRYFSRIGLSVDDFQDEDDPDQYSMSATVEVVLLHLSLALKKHGVLRLRVTNAAGTRPR